MHQRFSMCSFVSREFPFASFSFLIPLTSGGMLPSSAVHTIWIFFLTEVSALYIVFGVSNQCLLIK